MSLPSYLYPGLAYLRFRVALVGHIDFSGFITFNTIFISILCRFSLMLRARSYRRRYSFYSGGCLVKAFPLKHASLSYRNVRGMLSRRECAIVPVCEAGQKGVLCPLPSVYAFGADNKPLSHRFHT